MKRIAAAVGAAFLAAMIAACGGSSGPSVSGCTADIVAHPSGTNMKLWPHCKGLTQAQLWRATEAAMAKGAVG